MWRGCGLFLVMYGSRWGINPQKKTRMSGVQLAASQASSFERFSQMDTDKKQGLGGRLTSCVLRLTV